MPLSPTSRLGIVTLVAAGATMSLLGTAIPAQAATGEVVVFSSEFQPLEVFTNPSGCTRLPLAAHQVNNRTDSPVTVYADPLCLIPTGFGAIRPGHGAHVSQVGSFSVG